MTDHVWLDSRDDPDLLHIVRILTNERRRRRLRQADIAGMTWVSQATISRIEAGASYAFLPISAYARALGMRVVVVPLIDGGELLPPTMPSATELEDE